MNKSSEAKFLPQKIITYLESLGYPSKFIRPDIRTNQGRVADAVVYRENDEPLNRIIWLCDALEARLQSAEEERGRLVSWLGWGINYVT